MIYKGFGQPKPFGDFFVNTLYNVYKRVMFIKERGARMNKRGFGLLALIVVGIAALAVGLGVGSQAIALAPRTPDYGAGGGGSGIINAHECRADEVCEANGLDVSNNNIELGSWITPQGIEKSVLSIGESIDNSGNVMTNLVIRADDTFIENDLILGSDSIECDVFPRNGTGDETCQNNGYDFCLFAEYSRTTTYYDSVNGSCGGEVQVAIKAPFVGECNVPDLAVAVEEDVLLLHKEQNLSMVISL